MSIFLKSGIMDFRYFYRNSMDFGRFSVCLYYFMGPGGYGGPRGMGGRGAHINEDPGPRAQGGTHISEDPGPGPKGDPYK